MMLLRSLLLLGCALGAGLVQASCGAGRMLISGYFTNVYVYDACSGAFERVLDNAGRISGAMAVAQRPDGKLYVVSEETGTILRYDARTLEFVDTFINTGNTYHPTSLAFAASGDIYIGGFNADSVRRYSATGALLSTPVAAHAGGLDGPDNGMVMGPDDKVYIPGYNSNNVVRYDPATGVVDTFIPAQSGGLRHTRAVLFEAGGATLLVSSEGTGQILRYNASNGAFIGVFATPGAALGMNYTNDGRLLVAADSNGVSVLDATTGAERGVLPPPNATGGLNNSTYVALVTSPIDLSQIGTQYWIVGAGPVANKSMEIEMYSATGTEFGAGFNAANVVRKRWGTIRIDFTSCSTANYSWNSGGDNSARFGTGAYPLQMLLDTTFTRNCQATGFAQVSGSDWMNGTWFGGDARSGEGLLITVNPAGTAFVALFTHRPP